MKSLTFIVLLVISFNQFTYSQDIEKIDANLEYRNISSKVEFFIDSTGLLSIDSISLRENQFKFRQLSEFKNIISSKLWIKLILENVEDNEMSILLRFGNNIFPNGYLIGDGGEIMHLATEHNKKNIKETRQFSIQFGNSYWGYHSYWINLKAKKLTKLFFRIDSKILNTNQIQVNIAELEYVQEKRAKRNLFQGIFQGIVWILALYHLIIFFTSKRKIYLYYSLYLITISLVFIIPFGLIDFYLFKIYDRTVEILAITSNSLITVCYFLFISTFLENETAFQPFKRILKGYIKIKLMLSIIFLLGYSFFETIEIFSVINLVLLVELVFNLFLLMYLTIKGGIFVKYFAISNYVLIAGAAIGVYLLIGNPQNSMPSYFIEAGVVAQSLTLGLGIGYRMRFDEIEKQAAQKELIAQLEENKELQEKVTRELEEKVQERTFEINKQKTVIERKNKDITDSIKYASLIQDAVLPHKKHIENHIGNMDFFILYKPRDIVSGDFYWVEKVNGKILIAVADCTGHGVPGAFMSMMGMSFLNDIVIQRNIIEVDEILNELRRLVISTVNSAEHKYRLDDGMDISLCSINPENLRIEFAGAHNSALIIRKNIEQIEDRPEIIELKADRMPVGYGPRKDILFSKHEFNLDKEDMIYLFSDGFSDQFGGKAGTKFMSRNFKNLLADISQKPLIQQQNHLNEKITEWMEGFHQTDDILVMGIRV
jgi:serine phosphatase RsbU (regulator of sigma subunit)